MKKRVAASSASELVDGVVGGGWMGRLFTQRQHEIFGLGHNGGPGGAASGHGDRGSLSWHRCLPAHDERTGTMIEASSWGGGRLRR